MRRVIEQRVDCAYLEGMGESQAPAPNTHEESDPDADPSGVSTPPDETAPDSSPAPEGASPEAASAPALSWLSRPQELVVASIGGVGALIAGSVLGGSGTSVEALEGWAVVFCALSGLVTWFLPTPGSNPKLTRVGSWAAVALISYFLGPIHIALYRAEHDLARGTRSEKVAAIERLVRLGDRDLRGADLRELNLSDADIANVELEGANLSHSMLERTLLIESNLRGAQLFGASFRGANLSTARLDGAKLGEGAESARCDRFTQLPAGFSCYHGAIVTSAEKSP